MARIGGSGAGGAGNGFNQIQLISGGDATGSHVVIGTYPTIQAAVDAVPQATDSDSIRTEYTVVIPPGTYDEDLNIDITNRHIELTALGPVNIGLFNNTFWAASNTRNITITCSDTSIDSIRSTFGMGSYMGYGLGSTTHPAYSTAIRLSGSIIYNITSVGFVDIDSMISADISGDIDSSSAVTHNFHLYLTRCRVRGQVKGTRNKIQLSDYCTFDGLVTLNSYSTIRNSVISGGMTVSIATSAGLRPFGMVGTDFSGTFTGPANSMVLDSTSNYYFTANGASLAGGATQVIIENGAGGGISQLTGDVTAGPGSGSQVATIAALAVTTGKIANNAVTNAKLATMAANTVKANITAGTAVPTDVPLVATATNSSAMFRDSSNQSAITTLTVTTARGVQGTGGAITVTGGTPATDSAGGNATVSGAAGDGTTTGGNGGNVSITGGAANGDNTVSKTGGSVTITGGVSKGSGAGGGFTVNLGTGGPGTGTAGATGGTNNINGGTGGIGSATSGAGGNTTLNGGTGGAGVAGGTGGTATLHGGTGGTGSSSGGNGGAANVTGGTASNNAGSSGGSVTLAGAGGSSTGAGGAGGTVTITGGAANGDNTTNNNGGSITLTAGNSKGSSNGGAITLNLGVGGVGTGTTGAVGGAYTLNGGAGGVGSATGGAGGAVNINAGAGGASGTPGAGGIILFKTASTTSLTERLRIAATGELIVTGAPVQINTAGFGLQVKSGTNAKIGTATLVAGASTVSNTSVTANSRIFVTSNTDGGTPGFLRVSAKVVGTSFTITSSNALDTSTVAWMIVESL